MIQELKRTAPRGLKDWLQIYRCYLEAFPKEERKPFFLIMKMYRKGTTDLWCWRSQGKFAGFAATINGDNLILVDYFAVARDFRGKGVGSHALKELMALYGKGGFFVEIEIPDPNAGNALQREKRKQFYLRCGLKPLDVRAKLFGVDMELLGVGCTMSYDKYRSFYRDNYNAWAAEHIEPPSQA